MSKNRGIENSTGKTLASSLQETKNNANRFWIVLTHVQMRGAALSFVVDSLQAFALQCFIMPEVSRFLGIVIKMFLREHNPPHFHAFYGDDVAAFSIETGQMIQGDLPPRKAALVTAWAIIHREELLKNWEDLQKGEEARKINPLR